MVRCQAGNLRAGRPQGIAPTMVRLRKLMRIWRQRKVSFLSRGNFTLCVICQQSLTKTEEDACGPFHSNAADHET